MKNLTVDEEKQVQKLDRGFCNNINELYRAGSKHLARNAETDRMRDEAKKVGVSDEDIRKIKAKSSPYLHYDKTLDQYKGILHRYSVWTVKNHPDVENARYALKRTDYIREFLGQYKNANTAQQYRAAFTKILRLDDANKLYNVVTEVGTRQMPVKGRDFDPVASYQKAIDQVGDAAILGRAVGPRRIELPNIKPNCFFEKNGNLYCHLGKAESTKGGKERDSLVLPEYKEKILALIKDKAPDKPLFDEAPSHYNQHALRRLYAADIYNHFKRPLDELINERMEIHAKYDLRRGTCRTDAPAVYHSYLRDEDYDRAALREVAHHLGHGNDREDLAMKNYGDYF